MAPSVAFDMDSVESLESEFVGDFGAPNIGGHVGKGSSILDLSRLQQRPQQVIRGIMRHAHSHAHRVPVHNPDVTKHELGPELIEEDILLLETEATNPVEDLLYRTAKTIGKTISTQEEDVLLLEAEATNPVEDLLYRTAKTIGKTIGTQDLVVTPEVTTIPPEEASINDDLVGGVDHVLQYTKETLSEAVTKATDVLMQSSSSISPSSSTTGITTSTSSSSTSSTTTARTTGPLSGVLHIPGHEPETPADLDLVHRDRSLDEINGTELNGISVKDDSTHLTPEGATTLILVGMIIVFLVFICLIMFIQKLRRQRIEAKVQEDVNNEFTKTEMKEKELDNYKAISAINDQLLRSLIQSVSKLELKQPHELSTSSFMQTESASTSGNLGQLWFSIYYDYTKGVLKLSILHASYPPGHSDNPADVWVECCVLTPLNTVMADTRTTSRKATVAPVFNQAFTFKARADEVRQCLLRLTLYDQQPKKSEKAVGSIIVPLSSLDLDAGVTLSRILH